MNTYVCLYKTRKKLPIVLSKSEVCGNVSMRYSNTKSLLVYFMAVVSLMKLVRAFTGFRF
jgi:hypothetical protein